MDKIVMLDSLVKRYNSGAFTHRYVFGFIRKGLVYAVEVPNACHLLPLITYTEQRSGQWELKYRPNKAMQDLILANACRVEIIGSAEWFEVEKAHHNNNRGDCFEDLTAIRWNGVQPTKRNAKFTEDGDFTADGKAYQVKFGCAKGAATFTNEKTLINLGL